MVKPKLLFFVRIALAFIFIVSGYLKLMEPYQNFLAVVLEYKILSGEGAKLFAVSMPWIELVFGVFLLKGLWTRFSLEVLWFLNSLFIAAVASALWRKLPVTECGCFGNAASLSQDKILLLDGTLWVLFAALFFFSEQTKWLSLDEYFRRRQPKNLILLILMASLLSAVTTPSYGYEEEFTTGKDWVQRMSKKEKFLAVFAPYILYYRYGISFRKSPQEYISDIDKVLIYNPYLEAEDVANIFASTVYTFEPESRPAFEAMARELHYRNLNHGEVVYPRLLLNPPSSSYPNQDASGQ